MELNLIENFLLDAGTSSMEILILNWFQPAYEIVKYACGKILFLTLV